MGRRVARRHACQRRYTARECPGRAMAASGSFCALSVHDSRHGAHAPSWTLGVMLSGAPLSSPQVLQRMVLPPAGLSADGAEKLRPALLALRVSWHRMGMNVPTYLPLLAVATLGDETSVTLGLVGTIVVVALALGESRWQVAHLREWKHSAEAELAAVAARVTALEVREGRTLERLDSFADRLSRIEEKIDRLLERHAA